MSIVEVIKEPIEVPEPHPESLCPVCAGVVRNARGWGRPRTYCSVSCKVMAQAVGDIESVNNEELTTEQRESYHLLLQTLADTIL